MSFAWNSVRRWNEKKMKLKKSSEWNEDMMTSAALMQQYIYVCMLKRLYTVTNTAVLSGATAVSVHLCTVHSQPLFILLLHLAQMSTWMDWFNFGGHRSLLWPLTSWWLWQNTFGHNSRNDTPLYPQISNRRKCDYISQKVKGQLHYGIIIFIMSTVFWPLFSTIIQNWRVDCDSRLEFKIWSDTQLMTNTVAVYNSTVSIIIIMVAHLETVVKVEISCAAVMSVLCEALTCQDFSFSLFSAPSIFEAC